MKSSFFFLIFLVSLLTSNPLEAKIRLTGDSNSSVQILIYGSLQCPFTKTVLEYVPEFEKEFGSLVSVIFSHFPLSFQKQSQPAAIAAECANSQSAGYKFVMELISQQHRLSTPFFLEVAKNIRVNNFVQFENCLINPTSEEHIVDLDRQTGVALGVDGVPYSFVNGHVIDRSIPYKDFVKIINQKIKNK